MPDVAEPLCDPFECSETVVGFVDDHELALRLFAEVEGGEHAREDEDRWGCAREERAGDPPVRIRGFAEVRNLPLDPSQVLEVCRRRQEEHVDVLRFQPLGQASLACRIVEHARRV